MAKPSPTLSRVTSALVSMCSAVSWASPKMSDSAIVKQPPWAAPISSSGLVPGLPSKRLEKPYGYFSSAPLFVEMAPLPSLMPPSQTAAPNVIIFYFSSGLGPDRSRCLVRNPDACSNAGLAEFHRRNLFEDGAKLDRGLLT